MPHLALSITQTVFELATQFTPVPGLYPCVEVLAGIIQLFENVPVNRNAANQLCGRCKLLLKAVSDTTNGWGQDRVFPIAEELRKVLEDVKSRMEIWQSKGRVKLFMKQNEMADDIEKSNEKIDKVIETLQITAHIESYGWQAEFQQMRKLDQNELISYLCDIKNVQTMIADAQGEQNKKLDENTAMLQGLMKMMQDKLSLMDQGDNRHLGIQRNLHHIQTHTGSLLPNLELKAGEVRRIGKNAIGGSPSMDIWEGLYLDEEKVAIKVIRAIHTSEKNVIRFRREMDVWSKLWDSDRGRHILPFYGWCQTDGPYPYVVSPWQANGTAIDYVKKNAFINHKQLVLGIARGVEVLHTMNPPIIHGEIKGEHIQVGATGNPLLSDFGLSKMVEDMSGAPFTQSKGVSESCRWLAPELLMGESIIMTTHSDIWSLGMTILELMTSRHPFSHIKSNTAVVIQVYGGTLPNKPTDPEAIRKGFNDDLWKLLQSCWATDPLSRPSIQEVIAGLNNWQRGLPM